jgi:hypothetical protein
VPTVRADSDANSYRHQAIMELVPVAPLPVPVPLVGVDSLVSPAVRRLLEAGQGRTTRTRRAGLASSACQHMRN